MKVLITAGTGKVGRELTDRLLRNGDGPVIMTHSLEHLRDLPRGIEGITGDFEHPETWKSLFTDIDKLCLITPSIAEEEKFGKMFVEEAVRHHLKHIVLLSIYNLEAGSHIPHFNAKLEMEEAIKKSKIPFTFIRANNFFQNDELYLSAMEERGFYLQPIGNVGLNRVDVRDVADAMFNALTDVKHFNQSYPLIGSENLSGRKTAMIYSEMLGKKVLYPENCLEQWEELFKNQIPDWQLEEYKMMYEFFLSDGLGARGDAHERRNQILFREPRRFEAYAKELVTQKEVQLDGFEKWRTQSSSDGKRVAS